MNSTSLEERWSRELGLGTTLCFSDDLTSFCSVRRYAVRSRDTRQYSMETDITFQMIPPNVLESLVENRVLLRVYYQAGSYMTYQADGG